MADDGQIDDRDDEAIGDTNAPRASSSGVRAVDRAIAILKTFTADDPELTLTQISERVGLNKATAHRFLRSLEAGGFVARVNRSKSFRLGPALAQLASLSMQTYDLREVARPYMLTLAKQCSAAVHLGILDGDNVVYVEKVEPATGMLQIKTQIGGRRPLHSTALGKVLLAGIPPEEIATVLDRLTLTRFTPNTIGSVSDLREELARVRRNHYAIDNGEANELVRCIGVPIRNANMETVCALSVTTVGLSADSAQFSEIRDRTIQAGEQISADLRNVRS